VTDPACDDNAGSSAGCVFVEDGLGDIDLFADGAGIRPGSAAAVDVVGVVRGGSVEFDAEARSSPFTANERS
jgi:hypothetical protein